MKRKLSFVAFLCLMLSMVPYTYYYYFNSAGSEPSYTIVNFEGLKKLEVGQKFAVKLVKVMDSNSFDFLLEGDIWIKGVVPVIPKEEAYGFVLETLPKVQNPTVLLRGKYKNIWIVEFDFVLDGKATRLDAVLKENHLVFE